MRVIDGKRLRRSPLRRATAFSALAVLTFGCTDPTATDGGATTNSSSPTTATLAVEAPDTRNSTTSTTTSTSTTSASTTSATATSTTATASPTTTVAPSSSTPYAVPIGGGASTGWATTHSGYPATDIFTDCGTTVVAPVNGLILEVRRVDRWDATVDNPATRGGRSVAILGDDGVRYYMAHFESIDDTVVERRRIDIGQPIGAVGESGRASACHVHFAMSPPCPGPEWSVRRGVIWPYPYLDAWKTGDQRSPSDEIENWVADHPDACAGAMADPFAGDAASH